MHSGPSKKFLNMNPGCPQPLRAIAQTDKPWPLPTLSVCVVPGVLLYLSAFTDTPCQPPTNKTTPGSCHYLRWHRLWNSIPPIHHLNLIQPDSLSYSQRPSTLFLSLQFLNLPLFSYSNSFRVSFSYNSSLNLPLDCIINTTHDLWIPKLI